MLFLDIRLRIFHHSSAKARPLVAELEQLYDGGKFAEILAQVRACLPRDEAGNLFAWLEKSDAVHDLLAFLAERMLEMNRQKAKGDQGLSRLVGRLCGSKGRRSHAEDEATGLL